MGLSGEDHRQVPTRTFAVASKGKEPVWLAVRAASNVLGVLSQNAARSELRLQYRE